MELNITQRRARQQEEDYVKTILLLQKRKGVATPGEMAMQLGVTASNVYAILSNLEIKGYVICQRGNRHKKPAVILTQEGQAMAIPVLQRHEAVQQWLMQLGVEEGEAEQEACLMEHGLSDKTMAIIQGHVEMASGMFGKDIAYPEKMKQMREQLQNRPSQGKTQFQKIFDDLDRQGGYEALVEHNALVQQLGGQDRILAGAKEVEKLGGLDKIRKTMKEAEHYGPIAELAQIQQKVKAIGGIHKAEKAVALVKKVGEKRLQRATALLDGFESLREAERQLAILEKVADLGGISQIERKMAAIERLGGMDTVERIRKIAQTMVEVFQEAEN